MERATVDLDPVKDIPKADNLKTPENTPVSNGKTSSSVEQNLATKGDELEVGTNADSNDNFPNGLNEIVNPSNGKINCVDCAISTYDLTKNKKLVAALEDDVTGIRPQKYKETLTTAFPDGAFTYRQNYDELVSFASGGLKNVDDGFIIIGWRNAGRTQGHAFNVIKTKRGIVFIDGQSGVRYSEEYMRRTFKSYDSFVPNI